MVNRIYTYNTVREFYSVVLPIHPAPSLWEPFLWGQAQGGGGSNAVRWPNKEGEMCVI
jgi:hypothetical protein